jgi:thymus-specific serine protease
MPFAADNFKQPAVKYLTAENAMMDFVELVKHLRPKFNARRKAFIAIGGGYSGNLAAWSRMKFPNIW